MARKDNIDGQISFWDIDIPKVTEVVNIIEQSLQCNSSIRSITEKQEEILNKYKLTDAMNRAVRYAGGGLGIEISNGEEFKTIYINRLGEEEFVMPTQAVIQPIDELLFYKNEYKEINEIQVKRLEDLRQKHNLKSYIKRRGDKNIIIKVNDNVIAINQVGWVLEYSQALYQDSEIFEFEEKNVEYKVGDMVEALHGKERITGVIVTKYENQDAFNIIWDKKHSAFHSSKILRKVS